MTRHLTSLRPNFLKPLGASAALAIAPMLASCAEATAQDAAEQAEQTAGEQGGRQCFFARQVTGFRNLDDAEGRESETRLLVDVRSSDTYEFELQQRCPELRFARSIAFDQTGVGRICDGLDVDLIVPDINLGPQRCRVTMIRKLEPDDPGGQARASD